MLRSECSLAFFTPKIVGIVSLTSVPERFPFRGTEFQECRGNLTSLTSFLFLLCRVRNWHQISWSRRFLEGFKAFVRREDHDRSAPDFLNTHEVFFVDPQLQNNAGSVETPPRVSLSKWDDLKQLLSGLL